MISENIKHELELINEKAEELVKHRKIRKKITLSECGAMKLLCDVYLYHRIDEMAQKGFKKNKNET